MCIGKDEISGHGFPAVARTILDEVLGVRPDYIEHQLAHPVRDPNGRAYNRAPSRAAEDDAAMLRSLEMDIVDNQGLSLLVRQMVNKTFYLLSLSDEHLHHELRSFASCPIRVSKPCCPGPQKINTYSIE
jgi:hypothetical protein